MSFTPDATAQAAIDSGRRTPVYCVDMDFSTGIQRWCTWTSNVISGGNSYQALSQGLYEISQIAESEDSRPDKMTFGFTIVNSAMLAACIGDSAVYRGRSITVSLQMLDGDGRAAGAPIPRWYGIMAETSIDREAGNLIDKGRGRINLHCYRDGIAQLRNYEGARLTDAQQQERFAGDLGLQYMADLIQNPVPWLSVRFQQQ